MQIKISFFELDEVNQKPAYKFSELFKHSLQTRKQEAFNEMFSKWQMTCSKCLLTEVEEKMNRVNDGKKKAMLSEKIEGKEKSLKTLLLVLFLY